MMLEGVSLFCASFTVSGFRREEFYKECLIKEQDCFEHKKVLGTYRFARVEFNQGYEAHTVRIFVIATGGFWPRKLDKDKCIARMPINYETRLSHIQKLVTDSMPYPAGMLLDSHVGYFISLICNPPARGAVKMSRATGLFRNAKLCSLNAELAKRLSPTKLVEEDEEHE